MLGPLAVKDENGVAGSAYRFTLGTVLFLKSVNGNDIPRAIVLKISYPSQIGGIAGETVGQVDDFFYLGFGSRQLSDAMCQMRRQIIVEEEFQAASLSSNSTASLTILGVMSNTRATIALSPPSARYDA